MRCSEFREHVHEFLDSRLEGKEFSVCLSHMDECATCRELVDGYRTIQQMISGRTAVPSAAAERMLRTLQKKRRQRFLSWIQDGFDQIRTFVRDLEPMSFWTKATALPVTSLVFFLLLQHFAPVKVESLAFLILSSQRLATSEMSAPMMLSIRVRQDSDDFNGLIDTARRLPYEDSLSLVAEIKPEGHAEIGDVLEYPRSFELLNAVNLTLRSSQFETLGAVENPFVIFTLQKIDVFEDNRGL